MPEDDHHQAHAFKLIHQNLSFEVCFATKSLWGFTEMTIEPTPDLKTIGINARQLNIDSITVDGVQAEYEINDNLMKIVKIDHEQPYSVFLKEYKKITLNPEFCEVNITLPSVDLSTTKADARIIVRIDFELKEPTAGAHFVFPSPGSGIITPHMFTENQINSSRLWFPCLDTWSQRCTWNLAFIVPEDMLAVSNGRLLSQEVDRSTKRKKCEYKVNLPTCACGINVCVGLFQAIPDSNVDFMTHFCRKEIIEQVHSTTGFMLQMFDYYSDFLHVKFPFRNYKQVFLEDSYHPFAAYSSISVFSTELLQSKNVIDPVLAGREKFSFAAASQFFGHYLTPKSWADTWLLLGLAKYISNLFLVRLHGLNESRFHRRKLLDYVVEEEAKGQAPLFNTHFAHPSELYTDFVKAKSLLVMRMIEHRVGSEKFQTVLNKLMALAGTWKRMKGDYSSLLVSTHSFLRLIKKVTGQDLKSFADQWIYKQGCPRFDTQIIFNKKKSIAEFHFKQDYIGSGKQRLYSGNLRVRVHELEETFVYDFHIEKETHKFDIAVRSKMRRTKKKKIRLQHGEEREIEFSEQADTPLLYVRVDPDLEWLRKLEYKQEDWMWIYQIQLEHDAGAQYESLQAFPAFPTTFVHDCLCDLIKDKNQFYRTRGKAASILATLAPKIQKKSDENDVLIPWVSMITLFHQKFSDFFGDGMGRAPDVIVRPNNFSDLKEYYLQKEVPLALSLTRDENGVCPAPIFDFFLHLLKYNDNRYNLFSDEHWLFNILHGISRAMISTNQESVTKISEYVPNTIIVQLLNHIIRLLNMDKLFPSFSYKVTCGCILALSSFAKQDICLNMDIRKLIETYLRHGNCRQVRLAAVDCLFILRSNEINEKFLLYLFDYVENDNDVLFRRKILEIILDRKDDFKEGANSYMERILKRLWNIMNLSSKYDVYLRKNAMALYKEWDSYITVEQKNFFSFNVLPSSQGSSSSESEEDTQKIFTFGLKVPTNKPEKKKKKKRKREKKSGPY